jgi:hypothetical protein
MDTHAQKLQRAPAHWELMVPVAQSYFQEVDRTLAQGEAHPIMECMHALCADLDALGEACMTDTQRNSLPSDLMVMAAFPYQRVGIC